MASNSLRGGKNIYSPNSLQSNWFEERLEPHHQEAQQSEQQQQQQQSEQQHQTRLLSAMCILIQLQMKPETKR